MPELPPAELVYDAVRQVVIPSAGAAVLAFMLILTLGRWAAPLGAGVGALAGVAFANWHQKAPLPWPPGDKAGMWVLPAASVLVAVGLFSRWGEALIRHFTGSPKWWLSNAVVWLPRAAVIVLVSGWGIPKQIAEEDPNLRWLLAAGTLLAWIAFDEVARSGRSKEAVALLALVATCSGGVMIFAHSAGYMEMGTALGMSLVGVAVVGVVMKLDVSAAIPAALGFLPGFVASGRFVTTSKVPVESFWLAALAPLALLPLLVPAVARRDEWWTRLVRLLLILAPLVAALFLANRHDPLKFEAAW